MYFCETLRSANHAIALGSAYPTVSDTLRCEELEQAGCVTFPLNYRVPSSNVIVHATLRCGEFYTVHPDICVDAVGESIPMPTIGLCRSAFDNFDWQLAGSQRMLTVAQAVSALARWAEPHFGLNSEYRHPTICTVTME